MLDVHPPEHAAHTWRDFLIHIATIVVGLLIAIGLEQSVEYLHHRREVRDTREALRIEREHNRLRFVKNVAALNRQQAAIQNNLIVLDALRQHPGTPASDLPGVMVCLGQVFIPEDAAWKTAQQSNVVNYMPPDEARENTRLYTFLQLAYTEQSDAVDEMHQVCRRILLDPDLPHLTPAQIDAATDALAEAAARTSKWDHTLLNLARLFPDFDGSALVDEPGYAGQSAEQLKNLARAQALTDQRLDAAAPRPTMAVPQK